MAPAPVPAPYPAPAPAPFPNGAAPAPAPMARAPYPAPAPASIPIVPDSESEAEETETEFSSQHDENHAMPAPIPAPAPARMAAPRPTPVANPLPPRSSSSNTEFIGDVIYPNANENQLVEAPPILQTEDKEASTEPIANGDKPPPPNQNLKAAADLINTLDTAYAQANAASATTALDADEARIAARTAAEIVRRYTTGSHPREGSDLTSSFDRDSPASAYRGDRKNSTTFFVPAETSREIIAATRIQTDRPTSHSIYFSRASPSSRLVNSRAEDALALSLELERAKQALETERMAHDETKNLLAEERSKNSHMQQKLQRLESSMETQRETLGRSGDALEEELQRAKLRMEAAEEDAQLALDFAKESEESREELERMLQQARAEIQTLRQQQEAMAQIQSLRQQEETAAMYGNNGEEPPPEVIEEQQQPHDETSYKSILKPMKTAEEEDGTDGKRSVHFSDPISSSNSPIGDSFIDDQEIAEDEQQQLQQQHYQEQLQQQQYQKQQLQQQQYEEQQLQQQQYDYGSASPLVVASPNGLTTPNRPNRPLVSAGRQLLQQSIVANNDSKTYSFKYTPEKSAERRQRLRDTLKDLDSSVVITSPAPKERTPLRKQLQFSTNVLELCGKVTEILQSSGSRLELDGHWWREKKEEGSEELELDSLARQYCQSVEVKISRQKNEISELESLCSFLEESVAS